MPTSKKRGRPPKRGAKLGCLVGFAVTKEQARTIRARAKASGMSVSAWVRSLVL